MRDQRPRHHITPVSGWLNDPNGLCRIDGLWHLFHQFNPVGPTWGPPHWAHWSSPDLVHWVPEPLALVPAGNGPDGGGIWSGCVVDDGGTPTALYTGAEATPDGGWTQTVCLATSDRSLREWTRDAANPVIPGPTDARAIGFRDPWVFRDGDGWAMLIGTGIDSQGGKIALFRGPDLRSWTFCGYVLERSSDDLDPVWTGRMWECPQLSRSGDTDFLVWSVWDDHAKEGERFPAELQYPVIATGHFSGDTFAMSTLQRFDYGADCYAPAFLVDKQRTLAWGWSWESLTEAGRTEQGWAGCLTYPREVWVDESGAVRQRPAAELQALRRPGRTLMASEIGPVGVRHTLAGDTVALRLRATPTATVCLDVLASAGGEERTRIEFDPGSGILTFDRRRSSLWSEAIRTPSSGPLSLAPGEELDLVVLIDVSIVEVFANERLALTERVYPTLEESTGIIVSGVGGRLQSVELTVWPLG